MSKLLLLTICCCLIHVIAVAYHIIGGEIYYQTVGYNAISGQYRYLVTLKLYRDADFTCGDRQGCLDRFENPVPINIYTADGMRTTPSILLYIQETRSLRDTLKNPCLAPQTQHLAVAFYRDTVDLAPRYGGYYIAYQRCCRGEKLANIYSSEQEGSTYYTVIPGTESRPNNNSAYFSKDVGIVICADFPFRYDYAATDPDGDSLTYSLCSALTGGSARNESNATTPPPYDDLVRYIPPYSGANPMGGSPQITIDSHGMLTGTPNRPGKFVVSVCVSEYDRVTGRLLGTHHKDILLTVFSCKTTVRANLPDVLNNCTDTADLRVAIPNFSNAGFTSSYYWSFSDGTDTTTYDKAIFYHQFPDTGRYTVKLVVNRGLPCVDSSTGIINNYPGLRVGFTVDGLCRERPVVFEDTSSYVYGQITSRHWDLGLPNLTAGSQRVALQYPEGGMYTITLTIDTDKGCNKSVTQQLRIYEVKPFAGNDTILARGQLLPLQASGGEFYEWQPALGLSNNGIANPVVNWHEDIQYLLRVSNSQGCVGYDTINIKYYLGPDVYIPNAFSPNGDGMNDRFRFIPVGFVSYDFFRIYNRWGEEIHASIDFRNGWDGTIRGRPAPVDTYIWILRGKDLNGQTILRKGTVTLVR
ncbi:PKD domain-containing protein [Chitinophaga japonensis]|uniref:Gliding motility-associated-like protein n=1 Tax=Chitinophaga japonensis TaxID=104662 RepID=A0A562TBG1_CHIJA|nr:PKD domain-containing protein [Chitinophaga japonensis]TWI90743.1 gliding motility-associated-like protein [Chitinophaga japonensis]